MMKIALYGPRGAGKSTVAYRIRAIIGDDVVALLQSAEPLYRLQAAVYCEAGVAIDQEVQDELVLSGLASLVRQLNPAALAERVDLQARELPAETKIVVCHDSIDQDRKYLESYGFKFIYVTASDATRSARLNSRGDVKRDSTIDDPFRPHISPDDPSIFNDGTIDDLDSQIIDALSWYSE